MFRFHDFLQRKSADFWRTYYQHPDLIKVWSYINSTLAAEVGGYPLLQSYDILDIENHLPGKTVVWEPITLSYIGRTTGTTSEYPYDYAIDEKWIDIDALYDKPADPMEKYQRKVDFRIRKRGIISFTKQPKSLNLLVSKGQITGWRLANEFGKLFGYVRQDSYNYRDAIVPLSALFYLGPTVPLIKAGFATAMNYPVTKYGDETVMQVTRDYIITDLYEYSTNNARVSVAAGDKVGVRNIERVWPSFWPPSYQFTRFKSLVDAIQVYTHKTHPDWWVGMDPTLFQRYAVVQLDSHKRDLLMDTFLKQYLALVRLRFKLIDPTGFKLNQDIVDLIYDAMPIRSAFIISADYDLLDYLPYPVEEIKVFGRVGGNCTWTNRAEGNDMQLSAPQLVQPMILPEDFDPDDPHTWKLGRRYHILEREHAFWEFWSAKPNLFPYVEPTYSEVFYRQTTTPPLGISIVMRDESTVATSIHPTTLELGSNIMAEPDLITSSMKALFTPTSFVGNIDILSVRNPMFLDMNDLKLWELSNASVGAFGLTCAFDSSDGTAESPGIDIGTARAKNITVTVLSDAPAGTMITLQYAAGEEDWSAWPTDSILPNITGVIKFKAAFTASTEKVPVLRGLILNIQPV